MVVVVVVLLQDRIHGMVVVVLLVLPHEIVQMLVPLAHVRVSVWAVRGLSVDVLPTLLRKMVRCLGRPIRSCSCRG